MDHNKVIEMFNGGFKNKKILISTMDSPFLDNQYVFPYLGILYLVSVAIKNGMRTKYIDLNFKAIDSEIIENYDILYTDFFNISNMSQYKFFDIICLSCMTPQGNQAYSILKEIKRKYPEMIVVIGGSHATFYYDECIDKGFDVIVKGDGERIFDYMLIGDVEQLINKLSHSDKSKSIVFEDYLTENEMSQYPVPYRERAYLKKYNYLLQGVRATTIVNSRGCPMGCAFCEHRKTKGRWFSVNHFESEIQDVLSNGFNGIMIFDDLFTINPKKLRPYAEILKKYHNENSVIYRCFGHAKIISKHENLIGMLKESGCVEIGIGAESASQVILDNVNKGTTVYELHNCVEKIIQAAIRVKVFFMIGLPGETLDTFHETYEFIKKYRNKYPDYFDFDLTVFFPYKGTLIGNVIRFPEGKKIFYNNKMLDNKYYQIRLINDLTWEDVDSGNYGAYKKKGGLSDVIVETYDWDKKTILLSSNDILSLKEKAMRLSKRYTDKNGNRIFQPVYEGSI